MMPFLFGKKEQDPLEAYLSGAFACTKCGRKTPLQGLPSLEMGRCAHCNTSNFVPKRINGFWLSYPLGGGGMGAVYKAYHEQFPHQFYAVKILPRDKKEDPELVRNLQSEATIVAALGQHPCVVSGVESGYRDGEHYLATQFIEGERLDKRIERLGHLPELEVIMIALRIIAAETHIYNQGYLFRDLKPENILITGAHGAYLYDYGICVTIDSALQEIGEFVEGSPFYMPPERLSGGGERPRSELYSLGMVLYHALAGKTYFNAKELQQLARQLTSTVRLSNLDGKMRKIPEDVATVIDNMIKREPERRYQTYIEVEREFVKLLTKYTNPK